MANTDDIAQLIVIAKSGTQSFATRFKMLFTNKLAPIFGVLLNKDVITMDPITAVFNFLSTPEGQKLVAPLVAVEADLVSVIANLIKQVAAKHTATPTTTTSTSTTTALPTAIGGVVAQVAQKIG